MEYIADKNYHRVLGIRPRGCDVRLQKLIDGAHKIVGKNSFIQILQEEILEESSTF